MVAPRCCQAGARIRPRHSRLLRLALPPALLAATLIAAGCGEETPAAPVVAPAVIATGPPEITFDRSTVDLGLITDTRTYRASFPFTNTGTGTLVISDVKASCGCTVPTLAKTTFAPGERSEIRIVFDPKGKSGKQNKTITVVTNAGTAPVSLTLASDIRPLLRYKRFLRFGDLELYQEHRRTVRFTYTDPDLEFLSISTNDPTITARLIASGVPDAPVNGEAGYRADVELTMHRDRQWGALYAKRLTVEVRGRWRAEVEPGLHVYEVFLVAEVFGELRAKPMIVSLGMLEPNQSFERAIALTRLSGRPFTVRRMQVLDSTLPGMQVRLEPREEGQYRLVLYGNAGRARGAIRGRLVVETDVAGEEVLEFPISGRIRSR